PGTDEEILSREELVRRFSLDGINRKSAIFDTQKLEWMNGRYLALMADAALGDVLSAALGDAHTHSPEWWARLAALLKVRSRTVLDMIEQARPYAFDTLTYDDAAVAKHWKDAPAVATRLEKLLEDFRGLDQWTEEDLETALRERAAREGVGAGKVIHPLRVALTGAGASPGIFEIAVLLGRDRVLARLERAIAQLVATAG